MSKKTHCHLQCGLSIIHDPTKIIVHGAQEHNLKNICFELPKGKLIALTGPSGSGKSSIATDVLQKECIRQYLESMGMTTDHIEKAHVQSITGLSPSIGISQRAADFNPRSTVGTKTGILTILRNMFAALGQQPCTGCANSVRHPLQDKNKLTTIEIEEKNGSSLKKRKKNYFTCPHCNQKLEKLTMAHFSSNTITGACGSCKGVGETISIDFTLLLNEEKTMIEGGVTLWDTKLAKYYENIILAARKHYNFSFDTTMPLKDYTQKQKDFLLYGINHPNFVMEFKNIKSPKKVNDGNFEGIIPPLLALYKKNPLKASQDIKKYILHESCTECNATGLAPLGRTVTVSGKTISDAVSLSLNKFFEWLHDLDTQIPEKDASILSAVSGALKERTSNLIEVGLHYVTLDRTVPSLSAGEGQRLRLASLLASGLCDVLYVLDEPTTGLHPHDTAKLLKTIRKIQQTGNTVLVIEHDLDVIRNVDYILDIGPEGGSKGGKIIASGTPEELMANTKSITGHYLNKKSPLPLNTATRKKETLTVHGAHEHNLKNIDVSIPLQQFVVITGVSGSGKSTFLFDIVDKAARNYLNNANEIPGKHTTIKGLENFNRIVTVNQRAIGSTKSSRSNVATYTKLFDYIRDLFATLPEAKRRNFSAESFSFNTSDQRCQNCNGAGVVEVDMTFMPDIQKECPVCEGTRFNENILAVQFKGYNIADILAMPVSDAIAVFKHEKKILALLELMQHVGLDYLTLGQSTSTLSGGEAQRIKLAAELAKSETGNTLYLLDEPTTGLHPQEVEKLLTILKKLVTQGNTVVVIEHNLEIIVHADTIIDFGPGGGTAGGTIVATGTPQEVIQNTNSLTGKALKTFINN